MTDELVQAILLPGLEPGAVDVFLEFICYSDGPLPEELLPQVKVISYMSIHYVLIVVLLHFRMYLLQLTKYVSSFPFFLFKCPVLVAWGDKDPWEPIELGRAYGDFDTVEDFVVLPDVGHCPQVSFSLTIAHIYSPSPIPTCNHTRGYHKNG